MDRFCTTDHIRGWLSQRTVKALEIIVSKLFVKRKPVLRIGKDNFIVKVANRLVARINLKSNGKHQPIKLSMNLQKILEYLLFRPTC